MTDAQEQLAPREPSPTSEPPQKPPQEHSREPSPANESAQEPPQEHPREPSPTNEPAQKPPEEQQARQEPVGEEAPAVEAAPSQFVNRLRGEVRKAAIAEAASSSDAQVVTPAEGSASKGPTELRLKGSGLKPFKLEGLPSGITVRDVKALSQRFCGMAPDEQKLLHKGKILNDSQKLEELNIATGAQLFLVRGAPPAGEDKEAKSSSQAGQGNTSERKREREEDEAHDFLDPWDDRPAFEDMDDEQLLQALMMGRLCRECGVNPGRLQTDGLCSVCFREMMMREHWLLKEKKRQEDAKKKQEEEAARLEEEQRQREEFDMRQKDKTRCKMCNKKHGLTGFMCRCGFYFCSTHRYAEDHGCTFDHQAHGREILSQQNPGDAVRKCGGPA